MGCRSIVAQLFMRFGAGLLVLGALVLIVALVGNAPQSAEEVIGDRMNVIEFIYLVTTDIVGGPLQAALVIFAAGGGMVLIAWGLAVPKPAPPPTGRWDQRR